MPLPPVADSVVVYEEPTLPAGRLEVVTTGWGWERTVRVSERAAVWVPVCRVYVSWLGRKRLRPNNHLLLQQLKHLLRPLVQLRRHQMLRYLVK